MQFVFARAPENRRIQARLKAESGPAMLQTVSQLHLSLRRRPCVLPTDFARAPRACQASKCMTPESSVHPVEGAPNVAASLSPSTSELVPTQSKLLGWLSMSRRGGSRAWVRQWEMGGEEKGEVASLCGERERALSLYMAKPPGMLPRNNS